MTPREHAIYVYGGYALAVTMGVALLGLAYFTLSPTQSHFGEMAMLALGIGCCAGLVLVLMTLTQRLQASEQARQQIEAKAAAHARESRAISAFLGNISHELRTPLNAIIGYADVLVQRMFGPIGSPRYEDYANNIRQGSETLLTIVNDLFEIARASARDEDFVCEPLDAGVVAGKVVAELHPLAADKNVALKIDVLPRPIWTYGHREALRQVMTRLIKNAIKFTDSEGTIIVKVEPAGRQVQISVTDNGIGIPQEDIERLGIPFQTVDNPMARSRGGLGLGLAIARGLVQRMEGDLAIESIAGKGTRVTVTLRDGEAIAASQSALGQAA
jgi:two-component system cell cycle sensor histidine kinase PleC